MTKKDNITELRVHQYHPTPLKKEKGSKKDRILLYISDEI